jgi:hypothetical protein
MWRGLLLVIVFLAGSSRAALLTGDDGATMPTLQFPKSKACDDPPPTTETRAAYLERITGRTAASVTCGKPCQHLNRQPS